MSEPERAAPGHHIVADSWRPGADPDKLIEFLARHYVERPDGVLRELLQNAADAQLGTDRAERMCEVALLDANRALPGDHYHLVIRDWGVGMTSEEFQQEVGILGRGSDEKRSNPQSIGEFGVGFYSTHAISNAVAVLTRKRGGTETAAWQYSPQMKTFFRVTGSQLDRMLEKDFEKHVDPARQRPHGTSVYLNLDIDHNKSCANWLSAEYIGEALLKDCLLLPMAIHIANYSGGVRVPVRGRDNGDLSEVNLSLERHPWDIVEGAGRESAIRQFFSTMPSYAPGARDSRRTVHCFRRTDGTGRGNVSGVLYMFQTATPGEIELHMKGMRVEAARDLKPFAFDHVHGLVNVWPDRNDLNLRILAPRDHVIRDDSFIKVREFVFDEIIGLHRDEGGKAVEEIARALHTDSQRDVAGRIVQTCDDLIWYGVARGLVAASHSLLQDAPALVAETLPHDTLGERFREAAIKFYGQFVPRTITLGSDNIENALRMAQEDVERMAQEALDVAASTGAKGPVQRAPGFARRFLETVSEFIPVRVACRQNLPGAGFRAAAVDLSLATLVAIDPMSRAEIKVLTNGSPDDYFAGKPDNFVVWPRPEHEWLLLAIVSRVEATRYRLAAASGIRDLFHEIVMQEEWKPIIALFDRIVNGEAHKARLNVVVRGFQRTETPLLRARTEQRDELVINAFNETMKLAKEQYNNALEMRSIDVCDVIAAMCHELYHYAQPAEAAGQGEDPHFVETRARFCGDVLAILGKYQNMTATERK